MFNSYQEGFGGHEGEVEGPGGDRCGTRGCAVTVGLGTRRRVSLARGAGFEVGGEEVWHGMGWCNSEVLVEELACVVVLMMVKGVDQWE